MSFVWRYVCFFCLSKGGSIYKVGDRIRIGTPWSNKTFAYISEGDGILLPITNLTARASDAESEIKNIFIIGTKRRGYSVLFKTKSASGVPGSGYTISVENAIGADELKSFGMSSDDALIELKRAKNKLDLDLILKEDYEKIKSELSKYIK